MSATTATPVSSRSRSGSTSASVRSYGTTTVVACLSRNDSMFKIPNEDGIPDNEAAPLLAGGAGVTQDRDWSGALKEAWVLVRYAAPIICTMLFEYSFLVTSVVAIGHLSTDMLAGAALGEITAGVTGFSILQGFSSALESLLPQAWTSDNPSHVGLWTQRMLVLATLLTMPIIVMWLNAEHIFLYLRQDPAVARYAALYLKHLVFMPPFYAFNRIIRRYFQAQGLMHIPSVVVIMVTPINILLTYLLVLGPERIRLGFIGAPIAVSISMSLMSCLYLVYGILFSSREAWHPISSRSFTDLPKLFRLGLAGVGHTAAEWWSWEFVSLATSQFGATTLAAQSILVASSSSAYMIHSALGVASAVRIGNLLGAGIAQGALVSSKVAMVLALGQGLALGLLFLSLRSRLAYLFNDDAIVAGLVSGIMPLLAIYQIVDAMAGTTGGILRACGKISTGAASHFVGYYILGIPFGLFLAFVRHLDLFGLWVGLTVALLFVSTVQYAVIFRLDWAIQVREAKARVKAGEEIVIEAA